jgi:D-inositol-3-phosphate glycosyltransferase
MRDESTDRSERRRPKRVAVISVHSSPLDQPGTGDAGGMNVYIQEVARRLAGQGIAVDLFTRRSDPASPAVAEVEPGIRLIQVQAGPEGPLSKEAVPEVLGEFLDGVLTAAAVDDPADATKHAPYDVVHSHYWLSGWVGDRAKEIWGVPHVTSFHTLGKVKNSSLAEGDAPEPASRVSGEERIVAAVDRILAPTSIEADALVGLYGAEPERIRLVLPGVDRTVFVPLDRAQARAELDLPSTPLLLFVGRLQPLKGPEVAIAALAHAVRCVPEVVGDAHLVLVGGPSGAGSDDHTRRLRHLAERLDVADRVRFVPAQPHDRLARYYAAADVVLMPSRSESFGLVALEAQSCGTPVVASAVGGLRAVVVDGRTGFLVPGHEPAAFADRVLAILADPALARRLSGEAVRHAEAFSWDRTVEAINRVYGELRSGEVA